MTVTITSKMLLFTALDSYITIVEALLDWPLVTIEGTIKVVVVWWSSFLTVLVRILLTSQ